MVVEDAAWLEQRRSRFLRFQSIARPSSADSPILFLEMLRPQHPTRVYDIIEDFNIGVVAETAKDQ